MNFKISRIANLSEEWKIKSFKTIDRNYTVNELLWFFWFNCTLTLERLQYFNYSFNAVLNEHFNNFLPYFILHQSYYESTLKPLIFRSSRQVAIDSAESSKTKTKVFGSIEFIFSAFGVIRILKTGKTAKPVNSRG